MYLSRYQRQSEGVPNAIENLIYPVQAIEEECLQGKSNAKFGLQEQVLKSTTSETYTIYIQNVQLYA